VSFGLRANVGLDLTVPDGAWGTATRFIQQAVYSLAQKLTAPPAGLYDDADELSLDRQSVLERKGHGLAVTRRDISRNEELKGFQPFTPICLGLSLTTQNLHHILVVQWVAKPIN
jgi:hypothetical protein